jgi:hypothetical protein
VVLIGLGLLAFILQGALSGLWLIVMGLFLMAASRAEQPVVVRSSSEDRPASLPTPPSPHGGDVNASQPSPHGGEVNASQTSPHGAEVNASQPSPHVGEVNASQPSLHGGESDS